MKRIKLCFAMAFGFSIFNVFCQTPTWNWAKGIHTNDEETALDVAVDPLTENLYVVGYWENDLSAYFTNGPLPSQDFTSLYGGNSDGFVAKYNKSGNLIWSFKIGCDHDDRINAVAVDPSGNIYITGYFEDNTAYFTGTGALTGTTTLTNSDNNDNFFIAKYNADGELLWVKQGYNNNYGGIGGTDVAAYSGGVFAVGYYNDDTDFGAFTIPDDGLYNQYFLVAYDINGNEQWVAHGATNNHNYNTASYFNSVGTDGTDVFISGNFKGPDFKLYNSANSIVSTETNSSNWNADVVLISFSVGGDFNWMKTIGGNGRDEDKALVLDADSIYLTGGIENGANFPGYGANPVTSSGNMDIFVSSFSKSNGLTGWVQTVPCTNGGDQYGTSITIDNFSNILVTGFYDGDLSFPGSTTLSSFGGNDGFIASYTNNGEFYWSKTIGSNGNDYGYGISSAYTDKVYVVGSYRDLADLDGITLNGDGKENCFIAQIDPCNNAVGGIANTSDNELCPGESATLTLSGYEGNIQWQSSPKSLNNWSNIIGQTSAVMVVTPANGTDYRAIVTSLACNADTSSVITVSVNENPTATISGDADLCQGNNATVDVTLTGAVPFDFTWSDGSTNTDVLNHALLTYSFSVSPADTTIYSITSITDNNGCSNTGTGTATVNVIPEVVIVTQPSSITVCPGANTSFSIAARGQDLSYQWKKDGTDIAGETTPVLLLNSVDIPDEATYSCLITSSCGGPLLSNGASLSVLSPTQITSHPASASLCDAEQLNLSTLATGSNITYQWKKDGVDIVGQTLNIYSVTGVSTSDNGNYTCEVSGSCGTIESDPSTVTVDAPIVITNQPSNESACPGGNISFNVTATGTNLSYQWRKDGVDIPGENSQSIVINGVTGVDAGNYRCLVSSPCGASMLSGTGALFVNTQTSISAQPADETVCEGDNASFRISANGSALSYQWLKDGAPLANGGSVSGATTNVLLLTNLLPTDAGNYLCQISGICRSMDSDPADLIVDDAISITNQPASQQACEGNNINFKVVATGSNLNFQWYKDGALLAGETNNLLDINSISVADEGDYRCVISNSCGSSVNSDLVSLTVNDQTKITLQPLDATECAGNNLNLSVSATGSGLVYQWYKSAAALVNGGTISGALTNNLSITGLAVSDAGSYYCQVSGDCGSSNSDPAVISVDDAITINNQPTDVSACNGDNITFDIIATGSNLSYQWQKDGIDIAGKTNSVLSINNTSGADVGSYRCVVANSCGATLNSQSADLGLFNATAITLQPSDAITCIGGNAGFEVSASGDNLTYQWKKNGVNLNDGGNISGSNSNMLHITVTVVGDNGIFTCEVSGSCGVVNSNPANLTLTSNTVVSSHPSNQNICEDGNAVFNVSATGANLSYQWQKDGVDIPGATASGYIINNVTTASGGVFRCVVTGDCGTVNSNGALLVIEEDISVTSQPTNDEVCENESAGISISVSGTSPGYQWKLNGVDITDGGSVSGATTGNLTINPVPTAFAGNYSCDVTGTCSNVTSNTVSLTVNEEVVITGHPKNFTSCPGDNALFSVTATGTGLSYQWEKDGTVLIGETNSALLVNNVTPTEEGLYRCIVTGTCGLQISNAASLLINEDVVIATEPVDESVCDGQSAGFTVSASGSGLNYQWKIGGVNLVDGGNISGAQSNNLSVSPAVLSDAGAYVCEITGTCGTVNSTPANLVVNESIAISIQPQDKTACPGDDIVFNIVADGSNLSYQWQKDGVDISGETNSGLLLSGISLANAATYRCVINGDCGTLISSGAVLTVNSDVLITAHPVDEKVCDGSSVGFVLTASGSGLSYQWKRNNINLNDGSAISGSNTNSLSIDPVQIADAGVFTCEVSGTCGIENSNPANLAVDETLSITSQPANLTACPGENANFSITASGTGLTYQWQKDGADLAGETASGLSLTNVAAVDKGVYRCVISGDCGTLVSDGALLLVDESISITTQPDANRVICEGNNLNLSIVATGTSLSYQWQKDGSDLSNGGNISGVTSDNLLVSNADVTDDGIYSCIITSTCGSLNSDLSDVVVNPSTSIIRHPVFYTIVEGGDASFSIDAEGDGLSYQWQKDGVDLSDGGNIAGSTTTTLNLTGVSGSDEGAYRCVVTGTCNTINSNPANLVVNPTTNILTQPLSITRCETEGAAFTVVAGGTGNTYQWRKDGVEITDNANISGSTTASLNISAVTASDAGAYTCIVNSESTAPAILTVNENPVINTHPLSSSRCEGVPVILSVSASGSLLTYQWQKDGIDLSDGGTISGASSNPLSLSGVTLADAGVYRCIVTGVCSIANSNPATLTINTNTLISTQPVSSTVCEGGAQVFSVVAGGNNLTYLWSKDGIPLSDGGNISGAATANLSVSDASPSDAGAYTCLVSGSCGSENSLIALLVVNETTEITLHPITANGCTGDNISFSVLADGNLLSYQWQKDGVDLTDGATLSGSNTANLRISGLVSTDDGAYVCVVSGSCGVQNSDPADLLALETTNITTQPTGDIICEGQTTTLSVVATGSNLIYQWRKGGVDLTDAGNISGSSTAILNISNAAVADAGTYSCKITGSCGILVTDLASIEVRMLAQITQQPVDAFGCNGDNISFTIQADGHNISYQWQKDGIDLSDGGTISGATNNNLTISGIVPGDQGSYRCVVTGSCNSINSTPATLSSYSATIITTQPAGTTVCEGSSFAATVDAIGSNLKYQWMKDAVPLTDGGNISGATTANLNVANALLSDAGNYTVEVSGECGSENSGIASVDVDSVTRITLQPIDVQGCEGEVIGFSVVATGTSLSYQWQKDGVNLSDGGTISGATTSYLAINGMVPSDDGAYRCIVTGTCNTVNSNVALLSSYSNTLITAQPAGTTVCSGNQVSMNVSAVGNILTYQWKKDGVNMTDGGDIAGTSTATLLLYNSTTANTGIYTCLVSGACGSENSSPVNVAVLEETVITAQPQNKTTCEGDVAVFNVVASGVSLAYQWEKDGAPLTDGGNVFGSTTSILTLNGLVAADSGIYRCVITGTCGTINSDGANLVVDVYPGLSGVIIGPASVCQGDENIIFEVADIPNATSYSWSLPVGASITSGTGTRLIEASFAYGELGGNIYVQGQNSCGSGTISVAHNVVANPIPSALAGADQSICTDNSSLSAIHPGTATGTWSVLDGPAIIQDNNLNTSFVSNLRDGSNTFIWEVAQSGCSSTDTVVISNNRVVAEAGTDVTICTESIVLEGNTPPTSGFGSWSVTTGAASFTDGSNPQSEASSFSSGINVLRWTITNGSCSDNDTVVIDNQVPTLPYAGIDQSICKDTTTLSANNPVVGAGEWTVISGSASFGNTAQYNTAITGLSKGTNILRWTITNGICSSIDEVAINNNLVDLNAGVDQVLCDRTTTLDADIQITGIGNWSVVQGAAAFVNNNLYNTKVTGLAKGENILAWNINNNGCISSDTVSITNDSPTDADAGDDQVITADFTTLQGNIPSVGTGAWSLISGSAVIADPSLYNTNVTGLALGDNTFRWTISNNSCTSSDEVIVTNFTPDDTDAGPDQTICASSTTMKASEPVFGFGEWSVIQGSATFKDKAQYNTLVTGLAAGDNILRWTVWQNGYSSDDVVITNDLPTGANAGSIQTLCSDSTALAGNDPIIGAGKWTVISGAGVFGNDTLYNTKVTGMSKGENIYKWTVTNKSCITSSNVTIVNDLPTVADAGTDQDLCTNSTLLSPNTPSVGSGTWSVIGGSAIFNGNEVSNLATGNNILRWTITNNSCSLYDDAVITNNTPSQAQSGADKVICYDSITLAANNPLIGTGEWSVQSGSGAISSMGDPRAKVTNLGRGLNVFRWTINNGTCTIFDEVVIDNSLIEAVAGADQDICNETTVLEANNPDAGMGQWSVLGGSGGAIFDDDNQPDTRVSSLDKGANILRWTIVNNICESFDDIVVTNSLPTVSYAGPDEAICKDSTVLKAGEALIGIGEWSILSGSAVISDPNSPKTKITNLGYGVNTLRWEIANGGCISTDEVVISNNSTVVSDAGVDLSICSDSSVLFGNNPPFGLGQWSVVSGSATFLDNNNYNTKVRSLGNGVNVLKWLISNGGCFSSDEVIITNNSPSAANAGADQIICGDSTSLFGNIPEIGTGQWILVSGAAGFTDASEHNTSVTGLNPGTNSLRWVIENKGCTSSDDAVITNDLPYVANAGQDMVICNSAASLFANDPVMGAGEWSIISGSGTFDAPSKFDANVKGLGFGVNTLRWTITYDECTTTDEIKVTNNQIEIYAGIDQEIGEPGTLLAANDPSVGIGQWSVIGGSGNFSEPGNSISMVNNISGGLNTYRWSVDVDGCISFDDVSVTYNVPPEASFVITDDAGCPPLEVYFVNNSLDNLSFAWDFGDGNTSNDVTVKHTYNEPGVYYPTLTIIGNNGELIRKDTVVTVYDKPEASFLVVNKEVYIPEEEALFINNSTYGETYEWEFGDGGSSEEKDPKYIYSDTGTYHITLHVWSENECYDSTVQYAAVKVLESGTVLFPNAFTPNLNGPSGGVYDPNDFSNDVFFPIGEGIEGYHLEVFNKWGILVFESKDFYTGWDGYKNGKLLNEGVYVWKVTGKYNNGRDFKKVGTVLLIR